MKSVNKVVMNAIAANAKVAEYGFEKDMEIVEKAGDEIVALKPAIKQLASQLEGIKKRVCKARVFTSNGGNFVTDKMAKIVYRTEDKFDSIQRLLSDLAFKCNWNCTVSNPRA